MKILVTGANGLLGQKLILKLGADDSVQTVATGRGVNRNPEGNYEYRQMDVSDAPSVEKVIGDIKPEVIIHAAAMTQVDDCEKDKESCWLHNVTAVEHLVKSCKENDIQLVHLSTDFVFDGLSGPYKEDDEPNPLSYYAKSKLASEKVISESTIKAAIVRTILVYGIAHDMSRSNIILWVKKSLEEGRHIRVVNDQWRMPTLAENLADGCILLAKSKKTGVYHLSGKDMLTPYDMAIITADYFGLDKNLIEEVDESVFTQPAKRPAKTGFILDKAINDLGYNPVGFREGLNILAKQLMAANPG